ncbi:MAG TPA: bifunctional proline dehydrogenase/L-glutamate gamma-semialdehyde dehydrogenase PutA, partial [Azospirillaceae bacterium]|nr:bifunctional proline dehydrogenase/L-glutamate gamma-semialdehyde dehydrogenase PutA [Azospirillaceae bacterium]
MSVMLADSPNAPELDTVRRSLRAAKHAAEEKVVADLLRAHGLTEQERRLIGARAVTVVETARSRRSELGPLDAFMQEFGLSNQEGIALMCIAECLLRIADPSTADRLIAEKIAQGQWDSHLGRSDSAFVNASAWALMLTGKVVDLDQGNKDAPGLLKRLITRSGEPVIRAAMMKAMRMMGEHFVMGRTIVEAVAEARKAKPAGTIHSYDMLGEGARTWAQADRYLKAYADAVDVVGKDAGGKGPYATAGVSIKLSALHPRYVYAKQDQVLKDLVPRVKGLALQAKRWDINLTIDAEEADRLELSLEILKALAEDRDLAGWQGLGLAIQAYQKRTVHLVDWLAALGRATGRRFMVRLVKGAYWDSEIKFSQIQGHADYPVFTKKAATDLSYLVCARRMLAAKDAIYPQFATHNAYTIAAILHLAGSNRDLEFQRLHGMGELLYSAARDTLEQMPRVRIYAPVGTHEDLLPYLVRRLLENGANSNFVNAYMDPDVPVGQVVADPVGQLEALPVLRHARIPVPPALYGAERPNSRGIDLTAPDVVAELQAGMKAALERRWTAGPIVGGQEGAAGARPVLDPSDTTRTVGTMADADRAAIDRAFTLAEAAQGAWDARGGHARADILDRVADLMEADTPALMALLAREAGKTLPDGVAEIR